MYLAKAMCGRWWGICPTIHGHQRYTKPDKDKKQVTSSAVAMNYFVGKIKKIFNNLSWGNFF